MSSISRITAALVAGAALAAGAIAAQFTYAHTGARHHRTHNAARSMPGRRHLLHAIAAALSPPSGTIVHERAMIATPGRAPQPFELWAQSDSPQAYRVIKWGHEGSWNGSSLSTYDPHSNTVRVSPGGGPQPGRSHQPVDFASSLRALVQSGQARVGGTSTIDGVSAYELSVGANADVLPPGSTAYVATSDYRPLVIDYNANGGQTISFEAYEYLPANAANLSVLNLVAQHPGARVVGQ